MVNQPNLSTKKAIAFPHKKRSLTINLPFICIHYFNLNVKKNLLTIIVTISIKTFFQFLPNRSSKCAQNANIVDINRFANYP